MASWQCFYYPLLWVHFHGVIMSPCEKSYDSCNLSSIESSPGSGLMRVALRFAALKATYPHRYFELPCFSSGLLLRRLGVINGNIDLPSLPLSLGNPGSALCPTAYQQMSWGNNQIKRWALFFSIALTDKARSYLLQIAHGTG